MAGTGCRNGNPEADVQTIEAHNDHVRIHVRVQPKASRNAIVMEEGGRIRVALTAPPVEGAANKALREYVAEVFDVSRAAVSLVSGEKSREKVLAVSGIDEARARAVLAAAGRMK